MNKQEKNLNDTDGKIIVKGACVFHFFGIEPKKWNATLRMSLMRI